MPALSLHSGPAVGEPQRGCRIATGRDEFEPLTVRDQMPCDPHGRDQFVMKGCFVVETKTFAVMTYCMNAYRHVHKAARTLRYRSGLPIRVVNRIGRILRKGMQNIGEQQFLMLLLVVQPDFDD